MEDISLIHQAECPHCRSLIDVGVEAKLSQRFICPICHALLEMIALEPPEVDWLFLEPGESTCHEISSDFVPH